MSKKLFAFFNGQEPKDDDRGMLLGMGETEQGARENVAHSLMFRSYAEFQEYVETRNLWFLKKESSIEIHTFD